MLLTLLACGQPEPAPAPDAPGETFDCASLPEPGGEIELDGPRGYKGLTFDLSGNLVGWDENALIKSTRDGDWSVFLPGLEDPEQMLTLPNGDLVVTSSWGAGNMTRVSPSGGTSRIASGLLAYSVVRGPDGMLWGAGWDGAYRVHPQSGDVDTLVTTSFDDDLSYRTVGFFEGELYLGTVDDDGRVFRWPLGDDDLPEGDPILYAEGVGGGWHDGLVFDVCGNMYVTEYESAALYRVSPDGEVTTLVQWSEREFGHGLVWGTGQDGWRADALYLPKPNKGAVVTEIVLGVPGPNWEGELL
jgi:glucose/arabinose dehydrogenase